MKRYRSREVAEMLDVPRWLINALVRDRAVVPDERIFNTMFFSPEKAAAIWVGAELAKRCGISSRKKRCIVRALANDKDLFQRARHHQNLLVFTSGRFAFATDRQTIKELKTALHGCMTIDIKPIFSIRR